MGCGIAIKLNKPTDGKSLYSTLSQSPSYVIPRSHPMALQLRWMPRLRPIAEVKSFLELSSSFDQKK